MSGRFLRHHAPTPRPWQVPLGGLQGTATPSMATLHVVMPAPTQFMNPTRFNNSESASDQHFSLAADHGVLVVHADEATGSHGQHIDDAPEHADVRVSEDLHVPEDVDLSTAVVSCHDGQLDIRIPMNARNGTATTPASAVPPVPSVARRFPR